MNILHKPQFNLNFDLLQLPLAFLEEPAAESEHTLEREAFREKFKRHAHQAMPFAFYAYGPLHPLYFPGLPQLLEAEDPQALIELLRNFRAEDVLSLFSNALSENTNFSDLGQVTVLAADPGVLRQAVKDSAHTDEEKWKLFMILEDPLGWFRAYVNWLEQILPDFLNWYEERSQAVLAQQLRWAKELERDGLEALDRWSYGLFEGKAFDRIMHDQSFRVMLCISTGPIDQLNFSAQGLPEKDPDGMIMYLCGSLGIEQEFKRIAKEKLDREEQRLLLCKNLGDKTRYEILKAIAQGEVANKELAKALGVSSATVSYHVNQLVLAGILKVDASKGRFGYALDRTLVKALLREWLTWFEDPLE